MKTVDYFGPKVARSKLTNLETNALFEICQKASEPFNTKLVGYIREEIGITDLLLTNPLHEIILDKATQYLNQIDSGMWKKVIETNPDFNVLELNSAWYNKQVNMESNPPHDHRHTADIVCVIFPKIYIDPNIEDYYINYSNEKQQGQLHFMFGEHIKNDFGRKRITVVPEEGDIFIFPSTLGHYTSPVLGNSVRYSVSCNFSFSKMSHRLLNKLNSHED